MLLSTRSYANRATGLIFVPVTLGKNNLKIFVVAVPRCVSQRAATYFVSEESNLITEKAPKWSIRYRLHFMYESQGSDKGGTSPTIRTVPRRPQTD